MSGEGGGVYERPLQLEQAADPAFPLRNPARLVTFKETERSQALVCRSDQEPVVIMQENVRQDV